MSQAATRPTPPPNTEPCTRAIVGFPIPASVGEHRRQRHRVGDVLGVAVRRHLLHPVEIGAGAEAPALPQQNDGAHRVVGIERCKRAGELRDQRLVERVVDVGPRERDHRHRIALFDDQRLVRRRGCRALRAARLRSLVGDGSCLRHVESLLSRLAIHDERSRRCPPGFRLRLNPGYIRNTPNVVGSAGRFWDAEIARPSTRRVSAGSMMPSSHSRALA